MQKLYFYKNKPFSNGSNITENNMDTFAIAHEGKGLLWLLPLFFVLLLAHNTKIKQFFNRFALKVGVQCHLDSSIYHEFRQVELHSLSGPEAADYVYVSAYGIFVVNTPNRHGHISGDANAVHWTQRLHNSEARFPNPLLENQRRIRSLSQQLGILPNRFYSVVAFPYHSQFQNMMPDNVLEIGDFAEYVDQYQEIVFNTEEVAQIKSALETSEFDTVFSQPHLNA